MEMEQQSVFEPLGISLVRPSELFQNEIWDFREEFLKNGEVAYGTERLYDAADFEEWLKKIKTHLMDLTNGSVLLGG